MASKHFAVCVCVYVCELGGGEVKGRAAVSSFVLLAMLDCITFQANVHTLIVMRTRMDTHKGYTPLLDPAIGH